MATAFVTDIRFDAHTMPGHPETAARLEAVRRQLDGDGLTARLDRVELAPAAEETLQTVHASSYLRHLQAACEQARRSGLAMWNPDTYLTPDSYEIARLAAGGVLEVTEAVVTGRASNGLAAIRPPGHHATSQDAMGFCLLNNVAVAARHAQRAWKVGRVAIVDYDVHHGNGTQDMFYTDPSVLYISTHQWPLFPGTGRVSDTGRFEGEGATMNIPLPPGTGDGGYRRVFDELVLPALHRFAPHLILVSAGFDAHWGDPLANMRLSLTGYDHLARELLKAATALCEGQIVFVMEGGYNHEVLAMGWANIARVLLGEGEIADPFGAPNDPETALDALIERLKQVHKLS